jgi:3-oxoacyl-[acyl-carrier protein] reductase
MMELSGKVAVVTGASKGIGAALAKGLAHAGARVVVNYASDQRGADKIVLEIEASNGQARAFGADVSDRDQAAALIAFAIDAYGGLDILVNNAGVYRLRPFEALTAEDFHTMFHINVLGPLFTMQAASAHLRERGSIINIATNGISTRSPGGALYTSSKSALVTMSQIIAKELGPKRIRVNVVCPGATETEGVHAQGLINGAIVRRLIDNTPLGRMGQPDDIVGPVVFLASDAARWVTGEVLFASGGSR